MPATSVAAIRNRKLELIRKPIHHLTMQRITAYDLESQSSADGRAAYWSTFYGTRPPAEISTASTFAKVVLKSLGGAPGVIVDMGCGNFRDSRFFAANGYRVIAVEQADVADVLKETAHDLPIEFIRGDVNEVLSTALTKARSCQTTPITIYARFLMHCLSPVERNKLVTALLNERNVTRICMEHRTLNDSDRPKHYGGHKRYFVDSASMRAGFLNSGNFDEHLFVEDRGLSPFRDEDPVLARSIYVRSKIQTAASREIQ